MTTMLIYEKDNFLLDCRVDCQHNVKGQNVPRCEVYLSLSVMVNGRIRRVNKLFHTKEEEWGACGSASISIHNGDKTHYVDWGRTELQKFLHIFIQLGYDIDQESIHSEARQLIQLEMQRHISDEPTDTAIAD